MSCVRLFLRAVRRLVDEPYFTFVHDSIATDSSDQMSCLDPKDHDGQCTTLGVFQPIETMIDQSYA